MGLGRRLVGMGVPLDIDAPLPRDGTMSASVSTALGEGALMEAEGVTKDWLLECDEAPFMAGGVVGPALPMLHFLNRPPTAPLPKDAAGPSPSARAEEPVGSMRAEASSPSVKAEES